MTLDRDKLWDVAKRWLLPLAVAFAAGVLAGAFFLRSPAPQPSTRTAGPVATPVLDQVPAAPVTDPVPLKPITRPPDKTLAMLEQSKGEAGDSYAITFEPYGSGPGAPGSSLVVRIGTAKPIGEVAKPYAFSGANVLADMSRLPASQRPVKGGRYEATLMLVPQGKLFAFALENVKAAR